MPSTRPAPAAKATRTLLLNPQVVVLIACGMPHWREDLEAR